MLRATATPFTDTTLGWPGTAVTPGAPTTGTSSTATACRTCSRRCRWSAARRRARRGGDRPARLVLVVRPDHDLSVAVIGSRRRRRQPTTTFTWTAADGAGRPAGQHRLHHHRDRVGDGQLLGDARHPRPRVVSPSRSGTPLASAVDGRGAARPPTSTTVTFRLVVTDGIGQRERGTGGPQRGARPHDDCRVPLAVEPAAPGRAAPGPTGTDGRASVESRPAGRPPGDAATSTSSSATPRDRPRHRTRRRARSCRAGRCETSAARPISCPTPASTRGPEPIIANVAVGDLFHTGHLDVVGDHLDGEGRRLQRQTASCCRAGRSTPPSSVTRRRPSPDPRSPTSATRWTSHGLAPVLADLAGEAASSTIVQAGGDGYLHAWTPDGTNVPGWPVKVDCRPASRRGTGLHPRERPATSRLRPPSPGSTATRRRPTSSSGPRSPRSRPPASPPCPSPIFRLLGRRPALGRLAIDGGRARRVLRLGPGGHHRGVELAGGGRRGRQRQGRDRRQPAVDPTPGDSRQRPDAGTYGNESAPSPRCSDHRLGSSACITDPPPNVPIGFAASGAFGQIDGHMDLRPARDGRRPRSAASTTPNLEQPIDNYRVGVPGERRAGRGAGRDRRLPRHPPGGSFLEPPIITDVTGPGTTRWSRERLVGGDGLLPQRDPGARASPSSPPGWTSTRRAPATSCATATSTRGRHPRGLPLRLVHAGQGDGQRPVVDVASRRVQRRQLRRGQPAAGRVARPEWSASTVMPPPSPPRERLVRRDGR